MALTALGIASSAPGLAVEPATVSQPSPFLTGVSAISPSDAWAVGYLVRQAGPGQAADRTLVEHWDGSSWTRVPSPNPSGRRHPSDLQGVAATSASDAWAVGSYVKGATDRALTLHWNGSHWTLVPSPHPSQSSSLFGVAARSAADAWAVGLYYPGRGSRPLIEHWDGTKWTHFASHSPARRNNLWGVSADSATDAWAVGRAGDDPLIEHWDGRAWARVSGPDVPKSALFAVTAVDPANVWAVGDYATYHSLKTLVVHWDGSAWTRVRIPDLDGRKASSNLTSISAVSPTDIWAIGSVGLKTLIEHWDGTRWTQVASPNPGRSENVLNGVSAEAADDAWTVGIALDGPHGSALFAHWDGTSWRQPH
jgi:hypothetical protein